MAQGYGYVDFFTLEPTAWRPIGYTVFVAIIYYLSDFSWVTVGFVQAAIGTGCAVLSYFIACKFLSPGKSLIVMALVAFWPSYLTQFTATLYVETCYLFTLLCCLLVLCRAVSNPTIMNFALYGMMIGISTYFRATLLPFVLMPGVLVLFYRRDIKYLHLSVVAVSFMLLVLSPWVIRNYSTHDSLILTGTYSGYNMANAMDADVTRGEGFGAIYPPDVPTRGYSKSSGIHRNVPPHTYEKYWMENGNKLSVSNFLDNPLIWAKTRSTAIVALWGYQTTETSPKFFPPEREQFVPYIKYISKGAWITLLITAFAGFFVITGKYGWRYWLTFPAILIPLILIYWTGIHILIFGSGRHNMPMTVIVVLLAIYAFDRYYHAKA